MHRNLKFGDMVKVWPAPGLLVQSHAEIVGRFLPAEGAEQPWTQWLSDRARDGSICLTDPAPKAAPAKKTSAKDKE